MTNEIIDDYGILLAKIKNTGGWALENASDRLKANEKIVIEAIKSEPEAITVADSYLTQKPEFIKKAVKENTHTFKYLSNKFKNDSSIVELAIKDNGHNIQFASDRLKDDESLALKAVRQNGFSLQHLSQDIQDNRKIVKQAIDTDGGAIKYASDRLRDDIKLVEKSLEGKSVWSDFNRVDNFQYASDRIKNDKKIVLELEKKFPNVIEFASDEIKNLCKDKDPVKVLESIALKKQIEKELKPKEEVQEQKPIARKIKL